MRNVLSFHRERPYEWKPGANTLGYWKFNGNLTDETGNTTASGSNLTYGTIGNNHYVENTATGYNCVIQVTGNLLSQIGSGDFCVSMWCYIPSPSSNDATLFGERYDGASPRPGIQIRYVGNRSTFNLYCSNNFQKDTSTYPKNSWYYITIVRRSGTVYLYINGQSAITPASFTNDLSSGSSHVFYMMGRLGYSGGTMPVTGFKLSEVIYEKASWSEEEITDYYNQTKSNYQSSLKSYEEIVAMATSEGYPRTNTVAELNTNKEGYYNKLNSEGHLSTITTMNYGNKPCVNGISYEEIPLVVYYIIYRDNNNGWTIDQSDF